MDRYSIALGKVPLPLKPSEILDDPRKIYYLGAELSFGKTLTAVVICHERIDATFEIDHTESRSTKYTNDIIAWLQDLNERFPVRYGLMSFSERGEKALKINLDFNSEIITRGSLRSLKNKIDEFYGFWMGYSNIADVFTRPQENATKLSFWALYETLTRDIPDLYTNNMKFNKHLKEIQGGVKGPDKVKQVIRFNRRLGVSMQGLTSIQGVSRHGTLQGLTGIWG